MFKLIDIAKGAEVGRWTRRGEARDAAEALAGRPLHWSSDGTSLLTRYGIATFMVVKVGFKGGDEWRYRAAMANDVRGCPLAPLVDSIRWLNGKDDRKRDVHLLEVERQAQNALGLPADVGLTADQWAVSLGITNRHSDCESLEAFNHGFEGSSLQGVIRMLWCEGGGEPPTTDQFIDRSGSGEWYPRACR